MSDWHRVWSKYWPDMRDASVHAKLLGAYILTCEHRATEGLYRLPVGYIIEDLRPLTPTQVRKAIAELVDLKFVAYDDDAQAVLILKALTYPSQAPKSEKHIQGALNRLASVPATPLRDRLAELASSHAPEFADALRNGHETDGLTHD